MNPIYLLIQFIFYLEFTKSSYDLYNSSYAIDKIARSEDYEFYENATINDFDFNGTNSSSCIDPPDLNLQFILNSYELNVLAIYADDINETISIPRLYNDKQHIDRTNCHETQFRSMNERSICPYKPKKITKTNRFPWTIMGVKCTCDYCRDMSSRPFYPSLYKCSPKFKKEYVLVRGKCNVYGVYNWKESVEYVPKLCDCKIHRNLKTYK